MIRKFDLHIDERSYRAKAVRPRPEIFIDRNLGLFLVTTSWSKKEDALKTNKIIIDYISSVSADSELTSPFGNISTLTDSANNIRSSILLANERIYRETNKLNYDSGLEIFVGMVKGNEFAWGQVGSPQAFLMKQSQILEPLAIHGNSFGDLPDKLIGVEQHCDVNCGSSMVDSNTKVLLMSQSKLPSNVYNYDSITLSMDYLSSEFSLNYPETPYWYGIVSF